MSSPSASADERAWQAVQLVVFDFDGVLTDNTVYVSGDGVEQVRCWRGDGIGLSAIERAGIDALVLSTEANPVVGVRCAKLGIACIQGIPDKRPVLDEVVAERGLTLAEVAYVGNDVNDLGCLQGVGLPIVVADAHDDVRAVAAHVTRSPGGKGAVREVCDRLVAARL